MYVAAIDQGTTSTRCLVIDHSAPDDDQIEMPAGQRLPALFALLGPELAKAR